MSILIRYETDNAAGREHFAGCFGDTKSLKEYCREKKDDGIDCCLFVCGDMENLEKTAALITDLKNDITYNIHDMKLIIYFSDGCDKALLERVIKSLPCNIFLVYGLKRKGIFECMAAKHQFTDLSQVCIVESAEYSPENINLSNIFYTYYQKQGFTSADGTSGSVGSQGYDKNAVKTKVDEYVDGKYKILDAADYSYLVAFTENPYNIDLKDTPFSAPPEEQFEKFIEKYGKVLDALIAHNIDLTLEKDFADTLIEKYSKGGVKSIVGKDAIKLYNEFSTGMEELKNLWKKESDACLNKLKEVCSSSSGFDFADRDGNKNHLKNLKAYSNRLKSRYISKYIDYKKAETKHRTYYHLIRDKINDKIKHIQGVINSRELTKLEKIFASIITNGSFSHDVLETLKSSTRSGNDMILSEFKTRPGFCYALLFISDHLAGNAAQSANFENFSREITDFIKAEFIMKPLLPPHTDITAIKNSLPIFREQTIVIAPDEYPKSFKDALEHAEDFNVKNFIKYNIVSTPSANIGSLLGLVSIRYPPAGFCTIAWAGT
jgi:hypothetical protein